MAAFVSAMERVVALPAWSEGITPMPAGALPARGIFYGYDFHIAAEGPRLIEINTNAGGGFLNLALLQAQRGDRAGMHDPARIEAAYAAMFVAEVELSGRPLHRMAIVDETPDTQYLGADFSLCRELMQRHGVEAVICAPEALAYRNGELAHPTGPIDLVYNRLTDFPLADPRHSALHQAWAEGAVVLTPHPYAHARYADKRHLQRLSDPDWLAASGVDAEDRTLITRVVPKTERVKREQAEALWSRRKQLFFKPATGFGSKAAYRGANVTHRVFEEILAGDYVAQALVPPSERIVRVDGEDVALKCDLRCYAYAGEVQLVAARLWQGQTTNFRTPGGGFAPVVAVS